MGLHSWQVYNGGTTGCDWFSLLDQGYDICAVFFDYSKAFDMVPHSILLQKLRSYNVNPHILRWLANYLSNRLQYVCANGASSNTLPVSSGVPQGSILGPCCSLSILMTSQQFHSLLAVCYSMQMIACFTIRSVLLRTTTICKKI